MVENSLPAHRWARLPEAARESGRALLGLLTRAGDHPLLLSIQRGLALILPLIMIGAFATLARDIPWPSLHQMLDANLGPTWRVVCDNLIDGSSGIASLALLCTLAGTMTTLHNQTHARHFVSPIMTVVVVLSCFFVITAPSEPQNEGVRLLLNRGLLLSMVIATLGSWILLRLARIRLLRTPFRNVGSDPMIRDALALMPAGILTIALFAVLRGLLNVAELTSFDASLSEWLISPFVEMESNLGAGLAYAGLSQILWFFGAHGPNLLSAFETHLLIPADLANAAAVQLGETPSFIVTKSFIDAFARLGGSGSTLSIILAILVVSRDNGSRRLVVFALLPALCNVNEPLLFGIPLILNPSYLIPFIMTPLIQTLTAFVATALDLIPHTTHPPNWTTPILVSGFVTTGSPSGMAMQLFNLLLGTLIYIPFVRLADRVREQQGKRVMNALLRAAEGPEVGPGGIKCLDRPGEEGRLAKALGEDLDLALREGHELFLEYQPQIHIDGPRVHGVEALVRWEHPVYGRVPPPVIVAIAEDMRIIDRLGAFVLATACHLRSQWRGRVPDALVISVNASPQQLIDPAFERTVIDVLEDTKLAPALLELEITESTLLIPDAPALEALRRLRATGVRIAIDDFGMGHTSLRYLRELPIDTVKIDRSLAQGAPGGIDEYIIRSINDLSRSLGLFTIVEGVETDRQLQQCIALGCEAFQGYLFSRPLSADACFDFIAAA
ncbi:EAL domain protein [Thiorhodococcus drewsii AZ1]|uniref:EAL domain protein n=1 Tax=Thiorhodococcus drewsii AZ1 TaxID=765913 RepID=G2E276_9GAMM|nr:EAL domain-containing protein [Thiorhodococcus drewsii]EGV31025.1 EAL domain protein [Thiorhodococcus drewsii AZ1]